MKQMQKTVEQKFFFFFTVTGCARVKLQQQGIYQTITLIDDLKYLFLGECLTLC